MDADTGEGASEENSDKACRYTNNCFQITVEINLFFDKKPEL